MRQPLMLCIVYFVSRLAQTTTSHTLGQLPPQVFLPHALFEVTGFTRGGHRNLMKRWFQKALDKMSHLFLPRKLEKEQHKEEAIKDYVNRVRVMHHGALHCISFPEGQLIREEHSALCQAFPKETESLCKHLAEWVHSQLLNLKRNCPYSSTAAQCLADFKIPLTHPLATERGPDATARSPYVIRKYLLSSDEVQRFTLQKESIAETREFFDSLISKASTIYLLMNRKLNDRMRRWSRKVQSWEEKRRLLHRLRFYFLEVLAEAPIADPVVVRLLWSMTTRNCYQAAKRRTRINYSGKSFKIRGKEALAVFWSDLVRAAIHVDEDDCRKEAESNCAVLHTYLSYKTLLHPRLWKAVIRDDFVSSAVRVISHTQTLKDLLEVPDVHALVELTGKCRDAATANFLYSFQGSTVKFGKLIDLLGRRKWSRKILASSVSKIVRQSLQHTPTGKSPQESLRPSDSQSPEQVAALALYNGFKSGSETWALTGNKGLGELTDFIIRRQVLKLWTKVHPRGGPVHVSDPSNAISSIQQCSHRVHIYPTRVALGRSSPPMIYADVGLFGHSKRGRPLLALVQAKKWSPTKKTVVFGLSGIALVFIAISGLTVGAPGGLVFPLVTLFAGLCMCMHAVLSTLKSQGLIPVSPRTAEDEDEPADDKEE